MKKRQEEDYREIKGILALGYVWFSVCNSIEWPNWIRDIVFVSATRISQYRDDGWNYAVYNGDHLEYRISGKGVIVWYGNN